MKSIIRTLLVALALGASGAYAQSAYDSTSAQSKYDSQSGAGNSANWGVGG
jgi:hypothetical protein